MIIGAHSIIYSTNADADRAFLRDVLKLPNADAGEGWLIFGLPPAEVAVHPHVANDLHEFYLMCADVRQFIAAMAKHGIACDPANDMGWGILTQLTLPGGGKVGVYQPRHPRPRSMSPGKASTGNGARKPAKRSASRATQAGSAKAPGRKPAAAAKRKATPGKAKSPRRKRRG